MKILYLANHLNIGGISSYIRTLSKGMRKNGHDVYVAAGRGETVFRLEQDGAVYIPVPLHTKAEISANVIFAFFKLLPLIKKNNIDIIHANTRVTQVLSCLLSRHSGKPFVSTCHGFFKKRVFRRIFPCWGKQVIAISSQVRDHLVNDFRLEPSQVKMVHNGVNTGYFSSPSSEYTKAAREKLGLGSGQVIGIIARLSEVKGHIYLIEAMKTVVEKFPATQLLIVGEGRIKKDLVSLAKSLGIENQIFFLPNMLDSKEALSAIDIFVLPSLNEGLGLSLMEAMSMAKPVIGSDVGGIKTLLAAGINGLLVKPRDAGQLSLAIIELLKDSIKRQAYGINARNFIMENFSEETMISETEKVYAECLNTV